MKFIRNGIKNGTGVLIHCQMGISRSVTMLVAYLMAFDDLKYSEALALVREKWKIATPNSGFEKQLIWFELMS